MHAIFKVVKSHRTSYINFIRSTFIELQSITICDKILHVLDDFIRAITGFHPILCILYLYSQKHAQNTAEVMGLVIKDKMGYYNFYWGRLFPAFDFLWEKAFLNWKFHSKED